MSSRCKLGYKYTPKNPGMTYKDYPDLFLFFSDEIGSHKILFDPGEVWIPRAWDFALKLYPRAKQGLGNWANEKRAPALFRALFLSHLANGTLK